MNPETRRPTGWFPVPVPVRLGSGGLKKKSHHLSKTSLEVSQNEPPRSDLRFSAGAKKDLLTWESLASPWQARQIQLKSQALSRCHHVGVAQN